MKKFNFTLQSLKKYDDQVLDSEKSILGRLRAELAEMQSELDARNSAVGFSKHAMKRIESRNIEILDSDMLQRLNDGIEIAAEKGSNETLVLIDRTAFVVSVKNRTVITTMSQEDLKGNIFTNIDSTVIM